MVTTKKKTYEIAENDLIDSIDYLRDNFNINIADIRDIIKDRCM